MLASVIETNVQSPTDLCVVHPDIAKTRLVVLGKYCTAAQHYKLNSIYDQFDLNVHVQIQCDIRAYF